MTEAEEIIAALEKLGLNALSNVHAKRREIEADGKDPNRSSIYFSYVRELDGHAEALAHALWIHKWHGKEVPRGTEPPATYRAIHHLHDLNNKKKEKNK